MAKFNAFDEHCDASAVLALLGKVPVFSPAVQSASNDVRQARNAWAHCVFSEWDPVNYQQSFNNMETLVKALGLPPIIETNLLGELKDWESKGTSLIIGNPGSLCVTRDITQVNYREHMRRSLGLKICRKMEIKIDETYHVASFCCP